MILVVVEFDSARCSAHLLRLLLNDVILVQDALELGCVRDSIYALCILKDKLYLPG